MADGEVVDVVSRAQLFRCDDPSAPELNTDPVVQGEGLARVAEQVKWHCVLLAALTLLLLAVVLLPFSLPSWPCPVLSLVRGPLWGRFAPFFMNLLTLGWTFRACGAFFRLRRRLRLGRATVLTLGALRGLRRGVASCHNATDCTTRHGRRPGRAGNVHPIRADPRHTAQDA